MSTPSVFFTDYVYEYSVNQNLRNLLRVFSPSVKIEVAFNVHLLETIPDKTAVIPGKPIQISITHSTQGDHITPNIHSAQ